MLALCISAAAHLRETERKEAAEREEVMDRKKCNLGYCDVNCCLRETVTV